jgi:hypothetical protein
VGWGGVGKFSRTYSYYIFIRISKKEIVGKPEKSKPFWLNEIDIHKNM